MVEIGGRPILWHVLQIYLAQGFEDFLLLTGYRGEQVESFVAEQDWPSKAEIRCLPTGEDTPTGGRLQLAAGELEARPFCLAYADGVADIDLGALLRAHERHGAVATMTVVRPRLPFGVAHLDTDDVVQGFSEKPRSQDWINGGFFCFEPAVLDLLAPDSVLERDPLERLAASGDLRAFRHEGFWHCMDTYKDAVVLNDLWAAEPARRAPWKLWD
ncbi:MAG TPA: sugar phosphate nucleotidyltransferase, partial [Solirubrobacteraceae bacterium]|nr:sugar phosphate nucleotidyltransferase [Solirubrobacteraceae bacterium]